LLEEERQWLERFRRENPDQLFFTTRSLNAIELQSLDGRVLPIHVHTSARPRGSGALLKSSVVAYLAGSQTITVATSPEALRTGTLIRFFWNRGSSGHANFSRCIK